MTTKVKALNVRLGAYPNLFVATEYQGDGNFRYKAKFIVEKGSDADKLIREAIAKEASEVWKEKAPAMLRSFGDNKLQNCYVDGEVDGFPGSMILTAARKQKDGRPDVRDRSAQPLTADDGKPYAGSYVIGIVNIRAQDYNGTRGIRCELLGTQFIKDGEPISGGASRASDSDFEDLGVEDIADMFA